MKKNITILIFIYLLIATQYICLGFQDNTVQPEQEYNKRLAEIELLKEEGKRNEPIEKYISLRSFCIEQQLKEKARTTTNSLLEFIVIEPQDEFGQKRLTIQTLHLSKINPIDIADYQASLAHLFAYYEQIDSMSYYLQLAKNSYLKDKKYTQQINLLNNTAFEMYFLERLSLAKNMIDSAEAIAINHNLNAPIVNRNIGIIYSELGNYKKAITYTLKYIQYLETIEDNNSLLSSSYGNLATIYSYNNDYLNSINYSNKVLKIETNSESYMDLATTYCNIGANYFAMTNYTKAKTNTLISIGYLNKSANHLDETHQDYINNYHQLILIYLNEDNVDSATYYLTKVQNLQKEYPYRNIYTYTCNSSIHQRNKNYTAAKKQLDLAIKEGIEIYGDKNDDIASFYKDYSTMLQLEGKYKEAMRYCQKGMEAACTNFSDELGYTNPDVKDIRYRAILIGLLEHKVRLMRTMIREDAADFDITAIYNTAQLSAIVLEELSRSLHDKESKNHLLNKEVVPTFESAILMAIKAYRHTNDVAYFDAAFQLSERSKSMLLMESMQEANANAFGGVPPELIAAEENLRYNISLADKKRLDAILMEEEEEQKAQEDLIFEYNLQLDALKHTFEEKYPKYAALKYTSKISTLATTQQQLDANTCLIEYFEGTMNLYIFSITSDTQKISIVPKGGQYSRLLLDFQVVLSSPNKAASNIVTAYNEFTEMSSYFYKKLLGSTLADDKSRLIIIPDGQIGYIPFEVLLTQPVPTTKDPDEVNFVKLPYLLKDKRINYNYSATLMLSQLSQKREAVNGKVLAMAPSYSFDSPNCRGEREVNIRKHLIELPGAAGEIDMLQNNYAGLFLRQSEASEERFKHEASHYGILHLAMHGVVDQGASQLSGLSFTEDNACVQDNFLYSYEIKEQNLHASLVVLSACQTGMGKLQRGEGVVSIGRSFMYAGSPSLLITLWSLNDQSGAYLMEAFYKNIKLGMEKDEAIRQAKLSYLDNIENSAIAAHPFLWAAFIQIGDYSPMLIEEKDSTLLYASIIGGVLLVLLFITFLFRKSKKA